MNNNTPASLSADALQAVIDTCEFDRWKGLQVEALDAESLTVRLPFRDEIVGTPKVDRLHGGIVASLIDATGCYLVIARLNRRVSTISLVVDYLRAPHGEMRATARVVRLGRRICNVAVEVIGADGKLCATGRVTLVPSDTAIGEERTGARIT